MKKEFWFRIRHWQLFLMMLFIPWIMFSVFVTLTMYVDLKFDGMFIVSISYYVIFLLWCKSIIVNFNDSESILTETDRKRIDIYYKYLIVYVVLLIVISSLKVQSSFIAVIDMFLHLFMMFSIFAIVYYAAKTFMYKKQNKKVELSSIIFTMILMLMMPIGVWIIQPKLNQYLTKVKLNK